MFYEIPCSLDLGGSPLHSVVVVLVSWQSFFRIFGLSEDSGVCSANGISTSLMRSVNETGFSVDDAFSGVLISMQRMMSLQFTA